MKPLHFSSLLLICLVFSFCSSSKQSTGAGGSVKKSGKVTMLDENTFRLTEVSDDESYGYSEKNAIQVGGKIESGAKNEGLFLNALLGPNGEDVKYRRLGSCCSVKSRNAIFGNSVPLDRYEVTYEGLSTPIFLYINMYDSDILMKAPKGFTFRK
jgi:hypothetical protein